MGFPPQHGEDDRRGGGDARLPKLPWLFWDGACGFCAWWVEWIGKKGGQDRFRIVPYQDAPDPPMDAELLRSARRSVLIVFPDGRRLEDGRACLWILESLGYTRFARVLGTRPLFPLVATGYRYVSARRGFFGRFLRRNPRR